MTRFLRDRVRTGAADRDAGSSLVEMLVTIALGVLVMGMVATLCISVSRVTRVQAARSQNNNQAGTALDETTKLFRAATPICDQAFDATCVNEAPPIAVGAIATDVTFYTATDIKYSTSGGVEVPSHLGPLKVRLTIVAGVLTEYVYYPEMFAPTGGGANVCCRYPTLSRTRILARNVKTAAGATAISPFRYYDRLAELAVPLSATNAALVRRVQIDLFVEETQTPRVNGARLTDLVSLPNFPVT